MMAQTSTTPACDSVVTAQHRNKMQTSVGLGSLDYPLLQKCDIIELDLSTNLNSYEHNVVEDDLLKSSAATKFISMFWWGSGCSVYGFPCWVLSLVLFVFVFYHGVGFVFESEYPFGTVSSACIVMFWRTQLFTYVALNHYT